MTTFAAPNWQQGGGEIVIEVAITFIISIVAGVLANSISKWLDGKNDGE